MSRRISLCLVMIISLFQLSVAQISGRVYNESTSKPVSGLDMVLGTQTVRTDFSGYFEISAEIGDTLGVFKNGHYIGWVRINESYLSIYLNLEARQLDEVIISAFNENRSVKKVAGSIVLLEKGTISKTDDQSLVQAMNQLPGVQFEERSPGSYRINIRGSSIRAPFDVRNVKVYWNGIPFTEPGGNTPFNLLDPTNMESIEIVKGPSSLYGAGNGGVILMNTYPTGDSLNAMAGVQFGSYGLRRYSGRLNNISDRSRTLVHYSKHHYSGYREHSNFDRTSIEYSGQHKLDSNQFLQINFLFTDLAYQIPGGLTEEQMKSDPQQSRPGNAFAMGTRESNSSIDVKNLLMGIGHKLFKKNYNHYTNIYAIMTDFSNPFIFDYKREAHAGFGLRTLMEQKLDQLSYPMSLKVGGEYQSRHSSARNFGNDFGEPDTLNFDDNIISRQWLTFIQSDFDIAEKLKITASLSFSQLSYNIDRIFDAMLNDGYHIKRTFDIVPAPRLGAVWNEGNRVYYLTYSRGFSPPTLEEVRTNEGTINQDLDAEIGHSIEFGSRGELPIKNIFFDANIFYYRLRNTIVDYVSPRGTDLFRNAGSTSQYGFEGAFEHNFNGLPGIESLVRLSYTYHHFRYREYVVNQDDYEGNLIPGVAPHTISISNHLSRDNGMFLYVNYLFKSHIFLDDGNTVRTEPFHFLSAKMGWTGTVVTFSRVETSLGVNNIFNQNYSFGNDVNAFGGRYYQPSPGRNYYFSAKVYLGR